jgi:branched-subunit amino acid aminotransferase/4-amino-4-deoxychorismate lyase
MRTDFVYLNGRIVRAGQAAISPFDIGLLRGYAVFDLLRTIDGRPFLLDEHLRRFRASAKRLALTVPVGDDEIAAAIDELLERNDHHEATVRLVLTGGVSPDGMSHDPDTPTFFILTHELHAPPDAVYERGAKLVTHAHHREVPEAKTTNYITLLGNKARLAEEGALDLLYHDGETVSEAATASFYVVKDATIHVPDADVLWGTVGELVLDWAKERVDVVRGVVTLADVVDADEAFLTSTTRGVVGIVAIDDHTIGDGTVGPITRTLMDGYRELTHRHRRHA